MVVVSIWAGITFGSETSSLFSLIDLKYPLLSNSHLCSKLVIFVLDSKYNCQHLCSYLCSYMSEQINVEVIKLANGP